ncbi:MAG: hypothetical protein M1837_000454, partial [Sclerophora amabilis]
MPQLPTRQLGKNGPQVTALGFGAMGLSAFYGQAESDEERFKILDRAFELGEVFWDSADVYMDNEDLIGKWFKRTGKRDQIFFATKFANFVDAEGNRAIRSDPEYVKEACEKSLRRLGIPVGANTVIYSEGKIKYLGLSEVSSASLRRAHAVHPISAVQIEYSPFALDIEDPQIELLKTCRELGVTTIAYSPLGRGMLTGQYKSAEDFEENDFRRLAPRFSKENFPKNLKLVDDLALLAKKKGCTTGQLTLAWLLAQGSDVIPIPGTKKLKYLEENIAALDVKLTPQEVQEVRQAVDSAEVHGSRYPEG